MSEERREVIVLRREALEARAFDFRHPLNPSSRLRATPLSQAAGLARTGVSLGELPVGHEAFVFHRHHLEEEWIYLLEGHGVLRTERKEWSLGAGDFVAFPAGSEARVLRNDGPGTVRYLMGGENREAEVVDFPEHGHTLVRTAEGLRIYPNSAAREGFE
jgi:uncharacterized cupin superfamily protein